MADLNLEGGIALLGGGGEQRAEILVGQMEIEPARIGADAVAPRAQHLPPRQAGRLRRQIPYRLLQRFLERHAHPTHIRSEERRLGKVCVSTWRSMGSEQH